MNETNLSNDQQQRRAFYATMHRAMEVSKAPAVHDDGWVTSPNGTIRMRFVPASPPKS